ncbi:MAG: GRP family sugar transporter [Terriglobia bacterium]
MFLPVSYTVALLMMLLGMFCWGSWANSIKLAKWRFELFYWDYALALFLTSISVGLTLGSFFGPETYIQNLVTADRSAWLYALLAGVVWNLGNVLLTAGVGLVGIAVAFPVSVGMSLVLGVIGSYILAPRGNPILLFAGVSLVFIAVGVNSLAYRSAASSRPKVSKGGLLICIASGFLFSGFGPLLTKAFSSIHPLGPYGVISLFTLGALASTIPIMIYMMRHPLEGTPVGWTDYSKGSTSQHGAGLLGGLVWTLGMTFLFVPQKMVGTALAYAIGMSCPLIAALWGVFIWREFRGAPRRSQALLALMFALYCAGLVFQTLSFGSGAR